jgi:hypothetical protein
MERTFIFLFIVLCGGVTCSTAFSVTPNAAFAVAITRRIGTTALYDSPPARQPRRNLQKRRRRSKKGESNSENTQTEEEAFWSTAESRPFVSDKAKEMGEDYWIDQQELQAVQERKEALKRREPSQIPNEKLWSEVLAPYKQNWIGIISVTIVVLATIVTKFPELLNTPVITFPDL